MPGAKSRTLTADEVKRLAPGPHYCDAPTKAGKPCDNMVRNYGDKCWRHGGPR